MNLLTAFKLSLFFIVMVPSALADFKKPDSDSRDYQSLVLENGLSVLLISDPTTEVAGAAVNVGVGMNDDPELYPGLAHLLEHVVFAGSERFPERGGFMSFMSERSGAFNFNGYTAPDQTSFMFQIPFESFDEALSRFSDFLTAPLLSSADVEKERIIVDHEFTARAGNQRHQETSVFKTVLDPSHPYARSFVGNAATLGESEPEVLRDALKDLFEEAYTARNMTLVVLGPESLQALESKVNQHFSDLPEGRKYDKSRFAPVRLKKRGPVHLRLAGQGGEPRLTLRFPFGQKLDPHGVDPFAHFSRLISAKHEGGLRAHLIEQGVVTDLRTRSGFISETDATLDIEMPLTSAGLERLDDIMAAVLGYISMLKREGVRKDLYQETQRFGKRQFHKFESPTVIQYVNHLARAMQIFPAKYALSGTILPGDYEPGPLKEFVENLELDRMVIVVHEPGAVFPNEDAHSDATFSVKNVSEERKEKWIRESAKLAFSLGANDNPYFTEDTHRYERTEGLPTPTLLDLGQQSVGFKAWFQQESLFNSHQGSIYIAVNHPVAFMNEQSHSIKQLYAVILNDALAELSEKGSEAGLSLTVSPGSEGIVIRVYGPTAVQDQFVSDALMAIRTLDLSEHHLRYGKKDFKRSADHYRTQAPSRRLLFSLLSELNPAFSDPVTQLAFVQSLKISDVQSFHERFWNRPSVTLLIHGNMDRGAARGLAKEIQKNLGGRFKVSDVSLAPVAALPDERSLVYDTEISEGAALLYARQPHNVDSAAMLLLTTQILHNHMFNAVRGDRSLGYNVYATVVNDYRHGGVIVGLELPDMTAADVKAFIDKELERFLESLSQLSKEELKQLKRGTKALFRENEEQLSSRGAYWWSMIVQYEKAVDVASMAELTLETLTADDLYDYASRLLAAKEGEVYLRLSSGYDDT